MSVLAPPTRSPVARAATLIVAALAFVLLVAGCGAAADAPVPLARWTFDDGTPVTLPIHLPLPAREARYVLRTDVKLGPELRGKDLLLTIPELPALVTATVRAPAEITLFDAVTSPPNAYRGSGPHAWTIPAAYTDAPQLTLELSVEHRWTHSAWLDTVPRLSLAEKGDRGFETAKVVTDAGAYIALGTLAPLGFAYLVLFFLDRRRVANQWFAIQAAMGSYYALYVLGASQRFFGLHENAFLGISQAIAPIAGLRFSFAAFELGKPPRIFDAFTILALVSAFVFRGPFDAYPLGLVTVVITSSTIVYHLFTLAKLARRRPAPRNSGLLLVGWAAIGIAVCADGPVWMGMGMPFGSARLGSWGLAAIAICQAITLMRDHAASLRRSDELNRELLARVAQLEARQKENEVLNEELRRQVAERSTALAGALSRLGQLGASAPVPDLEVGEIVDDRWRVERTLGAGGMGAVYAVTRLRDERLFAMKVIRGASTPHRMARFAREAQLVAQVSHRNVVGIVDVQVSSRGVLYLVMDFVRGRALDSLRSRYGDVAWALGILEPIADGLAAIHARGIVHRDLKPSNVMVEDEGGAVRITDFGISRRQGGEADSLPEDASGSDDDEATVAPTHAPNRALLAGADARAADVADARLTATGAIIGTPLWVAPEATRGEPVSAPADVYALGLVAVELLTSIHPRMVPMAVSRLPGLVSKELAAMIERALEDEPGARPSATAFAEAIRAERIRREAAS